MIKIIRLLVLVILLTECNSHMSNVDKGTPDNKKTMTYDSVMADHLGADDYGMRQYVMAFLKRGPNRNHDTVTAAQLQRAHLDNIYRLAEEGKLVLAGPFTDDSEIRGIYIFNVSTIQEAEELTMSDPAIKAGRLIMELHPWYGSAALIQIPEISKKITRQQI